MEDLTKPPILMVDKEATGNSKSNGPQDKGAADQADGFDWPDISNMTADELREELMKQRKEFEIMDKDLFKAQNDSRKLQAQLRNLQELNTLHGATHNNTSSAFTLPSEFKKLWHELVTELILDAFPDFLD